MILFLFSSISEGRKIVLETNSKSASLNGIFLLNYKSNNRHGANSNEPKSSKRYCGQNPKGNVKIVPLYKFEFFEVSELATLVLVPAVLEKSGNHVYIIEKKFNS